jgi:hypothetical protein
MKQIPMPALKWRSACGSYNIRILRRCFLSMRDLAIKHAPLEVGTTLVGQYKSPNEAVIISIGPLVQPPFLTPPESIDFEHIDTHHID